MAWWITLIIIFGILSILSGLKDMWGPNNFANAIAAPIEILTGIVLLLIAYIGYLS